MSKRAVAALGATLAAVVVVGSVLPRLRGPAGPAKVGEVVKRGDLSLSVLGWRELTPTKDTFPKPGNRFVAVEVMLVNGATPTIMDGLHLEAGGTRFEPDITNACQLCTGLVPLVGPALLPDQRVAGEVGFQVPKAAADLRFVFGKSQTPAPDKDALMPMGEETVVALGSTPTRVEPPAAAGERPGTHKVGEAVDANGLVMTVHGVEPLAAADAAEPPKRGNRYVVVDVSLENKRPEAAKISFVTAFHANDGLGTRYGFFSMTTIRLLAGAKIDEIAPGSQVRFRMAAEVPRDRTGLALEFEPEIMGGPTVTVALPDLPKEAEPPPSAAEAPEKPAPVVEREFASTVKLGEVASIGSIRVAVLGWRPVEGDEMDHPKDGNRFIAVEAMIVNTAADTLAIDVERLRVRDFGGHEYRTGLPSGLVFCPLMSTVGTFLEPGETVRGELLYEVPAREEELGLVVDVDPPVLFALGAKPHEVAPPRIPEAKLAPATEPGTTGAACDMAATVLSFSAATEPSLDRHPGRRWFALELKLENRGKEDKPGVLALTQVAVVDAAGHCTSIDASRRAFGPLAFRETLPLAAGGSQRGFVCFEAPPEAGELRLGLLGRESDGTAKKAWIRLGPVPRQPVGLKATVDERLETLERAKAADDLALVLLCWTQAKSLVEADSDAKPSEVEEAKARLASARPALLPLLARAYRAAAEGLLAELEKALAKGDDGFLEGSDVHDIVRDMRGEDPSFADAADELAGRLDEVKKKSHR
jgi:hypothetical protein